MSGVRFGRGNLILAAIVLCALSIWPLMAAAAPPAPEGAVPAAPWPSINLTTSVSPGYVAVGSTVTFQNDLTNSGDVAATGAWLAHTLPAGFTYVPGSTRIYWNGIQMSSANPTISGRTLTWSGLTVPARRGDSFYGINTMVQ